MSLARAWGRQLLGASTAALIFPFAMLAALVALALGGAFGRVRVPGQPGQPGEAAPLPVPLRVPVATPVPPGFQGGPPQVP